MATADTRLFQAGLVFAAASGVHFLDHLRRGQGSVSEELYWVGNLSTVLQVVLLTLVLTRHRLAPLMAAATGFPLALGYIAAHWLPRWSPLSDPLLGGSTLSLAASAAEVVGALLIGFAGLAVMRENRREARPQLA